MSISPCNKEYEGCTLRTTLRGCYSDEHHLMWPASQYAGGIARAYRELPENKEQLCRFEHNEVHATTQPPEKPSRTEMVAAIAQHITNELARLEETA